MKETGLMFKAPLVRSILDGSKTQTRRVVKLPHANPLGEWEALQLGGPDGGRTSAGKTMPAQMGIGHTRTGEILTSPHGGPGDRIYVRETHAQVLEPDIPTGRARGPKGTSGIPARPEWQSHYVYLADGEMPPVQWHHLGDSQPVRWTPSILMPKRAARIWLDITGVRLERLQDISDCDLAAEGIQETIDAGEDHDGTPRDAFRQLWESTGGDWTANPWCWVIDFKRIHDQKASP